MIVNKVFVVFCNLYYNYIYIYIINLKTYIMKRFTNKLLKAFSLYLVSGSDLEELKKKTHLIGGHTFAAYGSFYTQDMKQAKEFSDKSKEAIEDLISDFEDMIHYR